MHSTPVPPNYLKSTQNRGSGITFSSFECYWRAQTTERLDICQSASNQLYAVSQHLTAGQRAVMHSSDSGQTWDTLATIVMNWPRHIEKVDSFFYFLTGSIDNNTVQVLNVNTGLLTPIDTFAYVSTDLRYTYSMKSIGDKAFLATDWGLYRYGNGGSQIEKVYNEKVTMLSVRGDTLFSRTQHNFIYSLNFGQSWTIIPNDNNFYPGFPVNFYFVNDVPWLLSVDNYNSCSEITLWELNATLTNGVQKFRLKDGVCLRDFLVSSNGTFLMATDYYGILSRKPAESNWSVNMTGLHKGVFELYQQGDLLYSTVGYLSQDTGKTWIAPIVAANENVINSIVKKDGLYYAAFYYAGLWKSADLKNWQQLVPWVPHINKVSDFLITTTSGGEVQYSSDGQSWTNTTHALQQSHFPPQQIQGDLIYALRNDPDINKLTLQSSHDLAETWQNTGLGFLEDDAEALQRLTVSQSNVYLMSTHPQYPDVKIYASHDFGHNWQSVQVPNGNSFYNSPWTCSENLLFITDAEKIWASANDGELWIELDRDTFTGDIASLEVAFGKIWVSTPEGLWARNLTEIPFEIYKGAVYHDQNNNGTRDNGEIGVPNVILTVSNRDWQVVTDSLGNYEIRAELINDSILVVKPIQYCVVVPSVIAAVETHFNNNDFAIQITPNITDVSVTAVNTQIFRPGFETEVFVSLRNEGTKALDSVQLVLPDFDDASPIQYLGAVPLPSHVMGDTLIWNNLTIDIFSQKDLNIRFKTNATANWWETVSLLFTANKSNDANVADNVFTFFEPLFGAYDPNDKRVSPDTVPPAQLTETDLTYTIRFQNTGNYPANFVTILDTLPTDMDISTLKVLAASHDFRWQIINGRVLEFRFNPIFLPDSISNEPASHGFVQFSIRARGDLPLGNIINNRAAIYFDYNPPVMTEFCQMYIENVYLGTNALFLNKSIQISPNPASDVIVFEKADETAGHLDIYSAVGRYVIGLKTLGKTVAVRIADWPKGMYFAQWKSGVEIIGGGFVKE